MKRMQMSTQKEHSNGRDHKAGLENVIFLFCECSKWWRFFHSETLAEIVRPTKDTHRHQAHPLFCLQHFFKKTFFAENGKLMHFYLQSNSGDVLSVFCISADVFRAKPDFHSQRPEMSAR